MTVILSIQSHVALGHVGNAAAVFPLQRMGCEVIAINTVQFSNHTGYGSWTGQVFAARHISSLIDGLRDRGALATVDAVLSGYLGDATLGRVVFDVVTEIRRSKPGLVYCCDPVMGDVGRGLYVRPDIPALFRDEAVPLATILTPNLYELELLTGMTVDTLEAGKAACRRLHDRGVSLVLVTSFIHAETPPGTTQMLLSEAGGDASIVSMPFLHFDPAPNGGGDLTAALFLGRILQGSSPPEALAATATSVQAVFERTALEQRRELAIVASQHAFARDAGTPRFRPVRV